MDRFFEEIAARVGSVPGVVAVALGGSRARGDADAESDADFGIYYDPDSPPDIARLSETARELDDRHPAEPLTAIGGWGPWINGGGWLEIEGRRVDWIYRDLERVGTAISNCRAGRIASHYQPGHPHAFHTHMYMGEVHYGRELFDPEGTLRALAASTTPYPAALQRAIVDSFLWEADFALESARKSVARGDRYHSMGSFFRSVACVIQVVFAVNERYFVNEKRSVETVRSFERQPAGFDAAVSALFSGESSRASLLRLASVVEETRVLAGDR
jgi:predicted nucleotidyltransferase